MFGTKSVIRCVRAERSDEAPSLGPGSPSLVLPPNRWDIAVHRPDVTGLGIEPRCDGRGSQHCAVFTQAKGVDQFVPEMNTQ